VNLFRTILSDWCILILGSFDKGLALFILIKNLPEKQNVNLIWCQEYRFQHPQQLSKIPVWIFEELMSRHQVFKSALFKLYLS